MAQYGGAAGGDGGATVRVYVVVVRLCRGGERNHLLLLSPEQAKPAG
jgi:hypothetical protein